MFSCSALADVHGPPAHLEAVPSPFQAPDCRIEADAEETLEAWRRLWLLTFAYPGQRRPSNVLDCSQAGANRHAR